MIPNIIDLVTGDQKVRFTHYVGGKLWYEHENTGFQFPVEIVDAGNGVFFVDDKALFFMRWMRKHIAFLEAAKAEDAVAANT